MSKNKKTSENLLQKWYEYLEQSGMTMENKRILDIEFLSFIIYLNKDELQRMRQQK